MTSIKIFSIDLLSKKLQRYHLSNGLFPSTLVWTNSHLLYTEEDNLTIVEVNSKTRQAIKCPLTSRSISKTIKLSIPIQYIHAKTSFVFYQTKNDQLYVFGSDFFNSGILGLGGKISTVSEPTLVKLSNSSEKVSLFSCCEDFCVASNESKEVFIWGNTSKILGSFENFKKQKYFQPFLFTIDHNLDSLFCSNSSVVLVMKNKKSIKFFGTLLNQFSNESETNCDLELNNDFCVILVNKFGVFGIENKQKLLYLSNHRITYCLIDNFVEKNLYVQDNTMLYLSLKSHKIVVFEFLRSSSRSFNSFSFSCPSFILSSNIVSQNSGQIGSVYNVRVQCFDKSSISYSNYNINNQMSPDLRHQNNHETYNNINNQMSSDFRHQNNHEAYNNINNQMSPDLRHQNNHETYNNINNQMNTDLRHQNNHEAYNNINNQMSPDLRHQNNQKRINVIENYNDKNVNMNECIDDQQQLIDSKLVVHSTPLTDCLFEVSESQQFVHSSKIIIKMGHQSDILNTISQYNQTIKQQSNDFLKTDTSNNKTGRFESESSKNNKCNERIERINERLKNLELKTTVLKKNHKINFLQIFEILEKVILKKNLKILILKCSIVKNKFPVKKTKISFLFLIEVVNAILSKKYFNFLKLTFVYNREDRFLIKESDLSRQYQLDSLHNGVRCFNQLNTVKHSGSDKCNTLNTTINNLLNHGFDQLNNNKKRELKKPERIFLVNQLLVYIILKNNFKFFQNKIQIKLTKIRSVHTINEVFNKIKFNGMFTILKRNEYRNANKLKSIIMINQTINKHLINYSFHYFKHPVLLKFELVDKCILINQYIKKIELKVFFKFLLKDYIDSGNRNNTKKNIDNHHQLNSNNRIEYISVKNVDTLITQNTNKSICIEDTYRLNNQVIDEFVDMKDIRRVDKQVIDESVDMKDRETKLVKSKKEHSIELKNEEYLKKNKNKKIESLLINKCNVIRLLKIEEMMKSKKIKTVKKYWNKLKERSQTRDKMQDNLSMIAHIIEFKNDQMLNEFWINLKKRPTPIVKFMLPMISLSCLQSNQSEIFPTRQSESPLKKMGLQGMINWRDNTTYESVDIKNPHIHFNESKPKSLPSTHPNIACHSLSPTSINPKTGDRMNPLDQLVKRSSIKRLFVKQSFPSIGVNQETTQILNEYFKNDSISKIERNSSFKESLFEIEVLKSCKQLLSSYRNDLENNPLLKEIDKVITESNGRSHEKNSKGHTFEQDFHTVLHKSINISNGIIINGICDKVDDNLIIENLNSRNNVNNQDYIDSHSHDNVKVQLVQLFNVHFSQKQEEINQNNQIQSQNKENDCMIDNQLQGNTIECINHQFNHNMIDNKDNATDYNDHQSKDNNEYQENLNSKCVESDNLEMKLIKSKMPSNVSKNIKIGTNETQKMRLLKQEKTNKGDDIIYETDIKKHPKIKDGVIHDCSLHNINHPTDSGNDVDNHSGNNCNYTNEYPNDSENNAYDCRNVNANDADYYLTSNENEDYNHANMNPKNNRIFKSYDLIGVNNEHNPKKNFKKENKSLIIDNEDNIKIDNKRSHQELFSTFNLDFRNIREKRKYTLDLNKELINIPHDHNQLQFNLLNNLKNRKSHFNFNAHFHKSNKLSDNKNNQKPANCNPKNQFNDHQSEKPIISKFNPKPPNGDGVISNPKIKSKIPFFLERVNKSVEVNKSIKKSIFLKDEVEYQSIVISNLIQDNKNTKNKIQSSKLKKSDAKKDRKKSTIVNVLKQNGTKILENLKSNKRENEINHKDMRENQNSIHLQCNLQNNTIGYHHNLHNNMHNNKDNTHQGNYNAHNLHNNLYNNRNCLYKSNSKTHDVHNKKNSTHNEHNNLQKEKISFHNIQNNVSNKKNNIQNVNNNINKNHEIHQKDYEGSTDKNLSKHLKKAMKDNQKGIKYDCSKNQIEIHKKNHQINEFEKVCILEKPKSKSTKLSKSKKLDKSIKNMIEGHQKINFVKEIPKRPFSVPNQTKPRNKSTGETKGKILERQINSGTNGNINYWRPNIDNPIKKKSNTIRNIGDKNLFKGSDINTSMGKKSNNKLEIDLKKNHFHSFQRKANSCLEYDKNNNKSTKIQTKTTSNEINKCKKSNFMNYLTYDKSNYSCFFRKDKLFHNDKLNNFELDFYKHPSIRVDHKLRFERIKHQESQ